MRDMQMVLERWGAWAADSNNGVDYPPIAAGFKGLLQPSKKSRVKCCDEDGLIIDTCIKVLKEARLNDYQLVLSHYLYRVSLRKIAKNRSVSDGTIRKQMQAAHGFIACALVTLNAKLVMDKEVDLPHIIDDGKSVYC